jgi:hypothetical protein
MPIVPGLRRKYAEMLRLRRSPSSEPPVIELRALASEFPGALRELDALPEEEIERRLSLLEATEPGAEAPWMVAMHWFHLELGALLRAKRWLGPGRTIGGDAVVRFEAAHAGDEHALRWSSRLNAVARPPEGRLSRLALTEAATRARLAPEELRRWLGG